MIRSGTINTIYALSIQGKSIHAIARELGIARNTVRRYLRGTRSQRHDRNEARSLIHTKSRSALG